MQLKFYFCLIFTSNFYSKSCEKLKLNFSCNDLHVLFDESKHFVNLRRLYDNLLRKNDVTLSGNEIGYEFFKAKPIEFNISEQYLMAEIYTQTASLFYDQIKYNDYDKDIPSLFQNYSHCFLEPKVVPKNLNFTNAKYRSIDGSGNNLKYKMMGASFTSFGRFLKANYDDKIHSVRKSIRGYNLPSPRNIVRKLFLHDVTNLNKFKNRTKIPNMAAVMFGQYIAHDVSSRQAAQYIDGGNEGIRCCANFNKIHLPSSLKHSSCLPITISRSDPFYSPQNIKCMGFVRSHLVANNPYQIDIGEQVNTATSFLDHSGIYGSDHKTTNRVRSFNGGRLKMNVRNILPMENGTFFSGDDRVNQTPFLAIWHSIFIRNHNHLADKLAIINRRWDDERTFQEARRINIAVYQKIIYEEWLPIFLGKNYSKMLENIKYEQDVDASTSNEFASAAFRILHSFINSDFELHDDETKIKSYNLSDTIMNLKLLSGSYDDVLRGLLKQKMNLVGYSSEILNKLFKNKREIGLDLLSIDINRARDHGIPPYHQFRKMCNLQSSIKVYNDLQPLIPKSSIVQLRQTYKSVLDLDLIVGGALENIMRNENETAEDSGFFGPTFQCIIGEQFRRFKAGDSYFFSHTSNLYPFTNEQLMVINSYTMAHLLCENSDLIRTQSVVFLRESLNNLAEECQELNFMDLNLWREELAEE